MPDGLRLVRVESLKDALQGLRVLRDGGTPRGCASTAAAPVATSHPAGPGRLPRLPRMQPAVPFAALGVTALLAVAAWVALAAAVLALRGARTPALLVAAGGLLLAGVEVATALTFGPDSSDRLATAAGGRGPAADRRARARRAAAPGSGRARPRFRVAPAVVVPLAAGPPSAPARRRRRAGRCRLGAALAA